jgi:hypothetical protein
VGTLEDPPSAPKTFILRPMREFVRPVVPEYDRRRVSSHLLRVLKDKGLDKDQWDWNDVLLLRRLRNRVIHGRGLLDDQLMLFEDSNELQADLIIAMLKIAARSEPELVVRVAQHLLNSGELANVSMRFRFELAKLLVEIAHQPIQLSLFDVDNLYDDSKTKPGEKE